MNNGIKIILNRMRTNPEEFRHGHNSRWIMLVEDWWFMLTEEEREAFRSGIRDVLSEAFEKRVLEELMLDDKQRRKIPIEEQWVEGVGTASQLTLPLVHKANIFDKLREE